MTGTICGSVIEALLITAVRDIAATASAMPIRLMERAGLGVTTLLAWRPLVEAGTVRCRHTQKLSKLRAAVICFTTVTDLGKPVLVTLSGVLNGCLRGPALMPESRVQVPILVAAEFL